MCGTYEKDETVTQGFLKKDYFHVVLALNDGTQSSLEMMPSAIGRIVHTLARGCAHPRTQMLTCTRTNPRSTSTLCQDAAVMPRSKGAKRKKKKKLWINEKRRKESLIQFNSRLLPSYPPDSADIRPSVWVCVLWYKVTASVCEGLLEVN